MKIKIEFAERSAWRAVYLSNKRGTFAALGIDPSSFGDGPKLFGRWNHHGFKISIPVIRWNTAYKFRFLMPLYKLQGHLLHKLDGRFGWGSKKETPC